MHAILYFNVMYLPFFLRISITIGLILQLLEGCGEVMKLEKLPSIDDNCNQLEVAEYVDEIYQYYWVTEVMYNVFLSIALFFYQFILYYFNFYLFWSR